MTEQTTPYPVSLQALLALDVLQAELADIDDGLCGELLRVGGEVPGLDPEPA